MYIFSVRTVALHEPGRRGTWLDQIAVGEYPVFLRDGNTCAERNAAGKPLQPGEPSVCLVFATLEEARQFCEQKVRELPQLRCDIYDHQGLAKPPLKTYGDREWDPGARTLLLLAGAAFLGAIVLFWWDWTRRGELILPSIVAINLVAAALRLLFWGLGKVDQRRERSKLTA